MSTHSSPRRSPLSISVSSSAYPFPLIEHRRSGAMALLRAAGSLAGLARSAQRSSLSFNASRVASQRALYAAEAAPVPASDTDGAVTQVRCLPDCLGLSRRPRPGATLAPEMGSAWCHDARTVRDSPGLHPRWACQRPGRGTVNVGAHAQPDRACPGRPGEAPPRDAHAHTMSFTLLLRR